MIRQEQQPITPVVVELEALEDILELSRQAEAAAHHAVEVLTSATAAFLDCNVFVVCCLPAGCRFVIHSVDTPATWVLQLERRCWLLICGFPCVLCRCESRVSFVGH
jgi:hypothetical protein